MNWLCSETRNICPHLKPQPILRQGFEGRRTYCEATRRPTPHCLYFCPSMLVLRPVQRFSNVVRLMKVQKHWNCSEQWMMQWISPSWLDRLSVFGQYTDDGKIWAFCWFKPDVNHFFVSHNCPSDKFPPLFYIPFCIHPNLKGNLSLAMVLNAL